MNWKISYIQNEAWVGSGGQRDGNERLRGKGYTVRRSNIPLFGVLDGNDREWCRANIWAHNGLRIYWNWKNIQMHKFKSPKNPKLYSPKHIVKLYK